MRLRLTDAERRSDYYFTGYAALVDMAELFREYPFDGEVLEKAAVHQRNMEEGIPPFHVTMRAGDGCIAEESENEIIFEMEEYEIRDGKSRIAAVCRMDKEKLEEESVPVKLFLLTKERMEKMEQNRL